MSWDRTWRCTKKSLNLHELTTAAERIGSQYQGVRVIVEKEAADCTTCFFVVSDEMEKASRTFEISIYNMGKDGFVISLEADASDNHLSEDADQLAEDLAEQLGAVPLEL